MKKILLTCLALCSVWGLSLADETLFPTATGSVTDEINLLSPSARTHITQTLHDISNFEVALVILSSTRGQPVSIYTQRLGNHWKVGNKETRNGILITLVPSQREVRLDTGYGTETILTNAQAGDLLDQYAVPYFKWDQYEEGLISLTDHLAEFLKDKQIEKKKAFSGKASHFPFLPEGVEFILMMGVLVLGVAVMIVAANSYALSFRGKILFFLIGSLFLITGLVWIYSFMPELKGLVMLFGVFVWVAISGSISVGVSRSIRRGGGGSFFGGGGAGRHF